MKKKYFFFILFWVFTQNLALAQGPYLSAHWEQDTANQFLDEYVMLHCVQSGFSDVWIRGDVDTTWYNIGNFAGDYVYTSSGCRPDSMWVRVDSGGYSTTVLATYVQDDWVVVTNCSVDTGMVTLQFEVSHRVRNGYMTTISLNTDTSAFSEDVFFTQDTTIIISTLGNLGFHNIEIEVWESDTVGNRDGRYTHLCVPQTILTLLREASSGGSISSSTVKEDVLGLSTVTSGEQIRLYPNPSRGQFILEGVAVGENLSISNLLGEVLYSQITTTTTVFIDSELPSGVYLLNTEKSGSFKFVITK